MSQGSDPKKNARPADADAVDPVTRRSFLRYVGGAVGAVGGVGALAAALSPLRELLRALPERPCQVKWRQLYSNRDL